MGSTGGKVFTWRQGLVVGIIAAVVVGAMAAIASVAIASYDATGAAKVLAVVMPALSAVVGAAIGGGAGVAAGSAGKQAMQTQIATDDGTFQTASAELESLKAAVDSLHRPLRTLMASPQGVAGFRAASDLESTAPAIGFDRFDDIAARLGRLEGLLHR